MPIKVTDFVYLIKCNHCKSYRFFLIQKSKPPTKVTCLRCDKRLSFISKTGAFNSQVVIKKLLKKEYYKIHDKGTLMESLLKKQ